MINTGSIENICFHTPSLIIPQHKTILFTYQLILTFNWEKK